MIHNGSTYDYHFIIKQLAREFKGNSKLIMYKIKFIDSFRFVSTSLSSLVDSLSDGLYKIKCKNCNSFLDYLNFYDDKLVYRCFDCKANYNINFNNKLIDVFSNTYNI